MFFLVTVGRCLYGKRENIDMATHLIREDGDIVILNILHMDTYRQIQYIVDICILVYHLWRACVCVCLCAIQCLIYVFPACYSFVLLGCSERCWGGAQKRRMVKWLKMVKWPQENLW